MSIFDIIGKCDKRPVKCKVCGKNMYYGEEEYVPEYEIKIHQDSKQIDHFMSMNLVGIKFGSKNKITIFKNTGF